MSRRHRKRQTKFLSRKEEFSGGSWSGLHITIILGAGSPSKRNKQERHAFRLGGVSRLFQPGVITGLANDHHFCFYPFCLLLSLIKMDILVTITFILQLRELPLKVKPPELSLFFPKKKPKKKKPSLYFPIYSFLTQVLKTIHLNICLKVLGLLSIIYNEY